MNARGSSQAGTARATACNGARAAVFFNAVKAVFYYDYVCPFCFLASARLRGLAGEFPLETQWRGIEIHPEHPPGGKRRKKTERSARMARTLAEAAGEDGEDVRLPGLLANSRLCLEGAEFAKDEGRFGEFHDACYEAYFREGKNIGNIDTVVEIGEKAGLGGADLREALEKRSFSEKIEENMKSAGENMVLGVPTLYVNGLRIHGIQSRETYAKLMRKELRRAQSAH